MKFLRVLIRGPVLVCLVCLSLADCILRVSIRKLGPVSRPQVLHRWCTRILSCLRVQVSVSGQAPAHGLIVSNHLSYLDIFVLSAVARCLFVSKSEVQRWPLVGAVARMTGTVFIDRSRPSQTHSQQPQMQERLKSGEPLVLFPEGTSSDGRGLLPFHSSLFEPAVTVAAPVTAAYISYELFEGEGSPEMDVCYWGEMTLLPHLIKLLTKTGVKAAVRFGEEPRMFSDRKRAALEMQLEVARLRPASCIATSVKEPLLPNPEDMVNRKIST